MKGELAPYGRQHADGQLPTSKVPQPNVQDGLTVGEQPTLALLVLPLDDPAPLVVESVGDGWLPLVLLEPEVVPEPEVVAPLVDVVGTGAGHVEQVLGDSLDGVGAGAGRLLRRVPDLRRKSTRRASVARLRHTERWR